MKARLVFDDHREFILEDVNIMGADLSCFDKNSPEYGNPGKITFEAKLIRPIVKKETQ